MFFDIKSAESYFLKEVQNLILLLNNKGYFVESETTLIMSVDNYEAIIIEGLRSRGYKVVITATEVDNEGWMYCCYDTNQYSPREAKKLILDYYK